MFKNNDEISEEFDESVKSNGFCKSCKSDFVFMPDEAWWDERGMGYSTKLVKCPYCGKPVVLNHKEDYGFAKMNSDQRWF